MKRIFYLDLVRVLACLMVICMHAPMEYYNNDVPTTIRAFMVYSSYVTMPNVCLFFAISGALLLPAKVQPEDSWKWLKKRLRKVIAPTIIWTEFYLIVKVCTTDVSIGEIIRQICSVPFNEQGHGILWFMYTLIGLYLVTPIISPWIQQCGKKTLQLYLCLWIVTLCYPILTAFVSIDETPYGILYYFSGFAGYYVLGYYLNTYGLKGRTIWWVVLLIVLMPLMLLYKIYLEGKFAFGEHVMWVLGIICMLMLLCWWKICVAVSLIIERHHKIASAITRISNLSFGIYLMHIFVMRNCVEKITCVISNYYMQTGATIVCTVLITVFVSHLISLLSFGDYVIGYKSRKIK